MYNGRPASPFHFTEIQHLREYSSNISGIREFFGRALNLYMF